MPAIPDTLFSIGTVTITKNVGIMVFFAIIMLLASLSMIIDRKEKKYSLKTEMSLNYFLIILEGMAVGIITGIVGAGGGFLIIPALVLFANLPIKKAVSTSLLIISIKSLIGFLGDIKNINIDWHFLLSFTTVTILGILIGDYFSNLIEGVKLKKGFGWFALIMSIVIIFKELT